MADSTSVAPKPERKSVLELSHDEARQFFLKGESYCRLDLPPYLAFDTLISNVHGVLFDKDLYEFKNGTPKQYDDVNYKIFHNKDGKYAWRPFELIHPALYVSLVHEITKEDKWDLICNCFREFSQNEHIRCLSLPVVSLTEEANKAQQILHWLSEVEQKSIEMSLDYEYLLETDISDCYGSIYTHSIPWALHSKETAKSNKTENTLLGNTIDRHIRDMRHGQTNGIPQGSVLMDFIAEVVLGYADLELSEKLNKAKIKCQILRYRDDYRIFTKNPQGAEKVAKLLTETLMDLGLKLNSAKTKASNDVVRGAIKSDKWAWMCRKQSVGIFKKKSESEEDFQRRLENAYQRRLLIMHDHASQFPNAGSLLRPLNLFLENIEKLKNPIKRPMPLISIVMDIAYRNPGTYPVCTAILSNLLKFVPNDIDKRTVIYKILEKFSLIPNTEHMEIWLQRMTYPFDKEIQYKNVLVCRLVSGEKVDLWNNQWISCADLKNAIDLKIIVDRAKLESMSHVISSKEVRTFCSGMIGSDY